MICFAWTGFPQYGARCVAAFVKTTGERVVVVASTPNVPVKGMDELAGCPVHWIKESDDVTLVGLLGEIPRVLTVPGWRIPIYNRFRDEVHAAGGKVIAGCDNDFHLDWRLLARAICFRLFWARKYEGVWVPGKSGHRFMRFLGMPDGRIYEGSYAADEAIFHDGEDIRTREHRIIYVGQFIVRKNVVRMCRAFLNALGGSEWSFDLYGCGPLESELRELSAAAKSQIRVNAFLQPEELAKKYREARVFCLPSLEEHWGVVVHEAVLSGCYLMLSDRIGAREDFAERDNSIIFDPYDEKAMEKAFRDLDSMSGEQFRVAQIKSLELGKRTGVEKFATSVLAFGEDNGHS